VLAARYARREGFDEGLIWNGESVAEASSSNVFIIKEQQLITPPLSSGCLSGVMRKYLLAHASTCGLDPVEKKISANELLEADGMLLTNVIQGIRWVKKYREREYPVASAWKSRMESILIRA
jgi:branched-chain amino acid aminotransferase